MYNANDLNDSTYDDAYYVDYTEELMSSDTFFYTVHTIRVRKRQPTAFNLPSVLEVLARDGFLTPERDA
jgi:hypothetical protein